MDNQLSIIDIALENNIDTNCNNKPELHILTEEFFNKIKSIIKKNDIYVKDSISLKKNKKDYSIFFFTTLAFKITPGPINYFWIKSNFIDYIDESQHCLFEKQKSNPLLTRTIFENIYDIKNPDYFFNQVYGKIYNQNLDDQFSCCHLYLECSNNKSCICDDLHYARKCHYKKKLDIGIIYYGVNSTI